MSMKNMPGGCCCVVTEGKYLWYDTLHYGFGGPFDQGDSYFHFQQLFQSEETCTLVVGGIACGSDDLSEYILKLPHNSLTRDESDIHSIYCAMGDPEVSYWIHANNKDHPDFPEGEIATGNLIDDFDDIGGDAWTIGTDVTIDSGENFMRYDTLTEAQEMTHPSYPDPIFIGTTEEFYIEQETNDELDERFLFVMIFSPQDDIDEGVIRLTCDTTGQTADFAIVYPPPGIPPEPDIAPYIALVSESHEGFIRNIPAAPGIDIRQLDEFVDDTDEDLGKWWRVDVVGLVTASGKITVKVIPDVEYEEQRFFIREMDIKEIPSSARGLPDIRTMSLTPVAGDDADESIRDIHYPREHKFYGFGADEIIEVASHNITGVVTATPQGYEEQSELELMFVATNHFIGGGRLKLEDCRNSGLGEMTGTRHNTDKILIQGDGVDYYSFLCWPEARQNHDGILAVAVSVDTLGLMQVDTDIHPAPQVDNDQRIGGFHIVLFTDEIVGGEYRLETRSPHLTRPFSYGFSDRGVRTGRRTDSTKYRPRSDAVLVEHPIDITTASDGTHQAAKGYAQCPVDASDTFRLFSGAVINGFPLCVWYKPPDFLDYSLQRAPIRESAPSGGFTTLEKAPLQKFRQSVTNTISFYVDLPATSTKNYSLDSNDNWEDRADKRYSGTVNILQGGGTEIFTHSHTQTRILNFQEAGTIHTVEPVVGEPNPGYVAYTGANYDAASRYTPLGGDPYAGPFDVEGGFHCFGAVIKAIQGKTSTRLLVHLTYTEVDYTVSGPLVWDSYESTTAPEEVVSAIRVKHVIVDENGDTVVERNTIPTRDYVEKPENWPVQDIHVGPDGQKIWIEKIYSTEPTLAAPDGVFTGMRLHVDDLTLDAQYDDEPEHIHATILSAGEELFFIKGFPLSDTTAGFGDPQEQRNPVDWVLSYDLKKQIPAYYHWPEEQIYREPIFGSVDRRGEMIKNSDALDFTVHTTQISDLGDPIDETDYHSRVPETP